MEERGPSPPPPPPPPPRPPAPCTPRPILGHMGLSGGVDPHKISNATWNQLGRPFTREFAHPTPCSTAIVLRHYRGYNLALFRHNPPRVIVRPTVRLGRHLHGPLVMSSSTPSSKAPSSSPKLNETIRQADNACPFTLSQYLEAVRKTPKSKFVAPSCRTEHDAALNAHGSCTISRSCA